MSCMYDVIHTCNNNKSLLLKIYTCIATTCTTTGINLWNGGNQRWKGLKEGWVDFRGGMDESFDCKKETTCVVALLLLVDQ